jgi:hypothetical protein
MELTWIAIAASIFMGLGAVLIFIAAVRQDLFRNIEDVRYQVFWSDIEETSDSPKEDTNDASRWATQ